MYRQFGHRHERFGRGPFGHHGGHHGGRGFGGRGEHRGRRIGRLLEHGDLRFVVLALVAEKPRHGYEVMRELEARTNGAYRPSPGVIYPTFSLLEDEGYVTPVGAEAGRKAFQITEAGREALAANRGPVDAIFARLDEAAAQSSEASPKLQRAMQNLRTALALRLQRGDVGENQIDAIAAALDEAAGKIERV